MPQYTLKFEQRRRSTYNSSNTLTFNKLGRAHIYTHARTRTHTHTHTVGLVGPLRKVLHTVIHIQNKRIRHEAREHTRTHAHTWTKKAQKHTYTHRWSLCVGYDPECPALLGVVLVRVGLQIRKQVTSSARNQYQSKSKLKGLGNQRNWKAWGTNGTERPGEPTPEQVEIERPGDWKLGLKIKCWIANLGIGVALGRWTMDKLHCD